MHRVVAKSAAIGTLLIAFGCGGHISAVTPQIGPTTLTGQLPIAPSRGSSTMSTVGNFESAMTNIGDTWSGIHVHQHFDSDISDSTIASTAARYDAVWGADKPGAWTSINSKIITSWYMPFNTDARTTHDLTWWKQNHPSWILYQCNKTSPAWADGLKQIPLDISNPAVYQWQMQTYGPTMESGGYTALGADLVGLNNANGGCGVFVNGVWTPRFSGQVVDAAWSQAVLAWVAYVQSYLHSMSRPLLLGINHVPENRKPGDTTEQQLIGYADFINDEYSFTSYGNGYVSNPTFYATVQWMKYVQQQGKAWYVDDKWNTSTLSSQQRNWAIATYLMGKYHHATLWVDHLPGYGYEYWYSQYTASVGYPCADMYLDSSKTGLYYRKYSGAFVIVNASTKSLTATLPNSSYTSIDGLTVTSPTTIGADSGEVLLTTNGCL